MNLSVDVITHILSFGDRLPRYKNVSKMWLLATELMYPRWKKHLDIEYPFWDTIASGQLLKYYLLKAIYHSDWDSFQVMIDLGWSIDQLDHSYMNSIILLQGNWRLVKWLFLRFPSYKMKLYLDIYFRCMEFPLLMSEIIKENHLRLKNYICSPYLTYEMVQEMKKYLPAFRETGEHPIRRYMKEGKHKFITDLSPLTPEIEEYMKKNNLRSPFSYMNIYVFPEDLEHPERKIESFIAWCQGKYIPVPSNALTMKLHERIAFINEHK